jgi:hypothetical protein
MRPRLGFSKQRKAKAKEKRKRKKKEKKSYILPILANHIEVILSKINLFFKCNI